MRLILEAILGTDLGEGLLGVTLITTIITVRRRFEAVIQLLQSVFLYLIVYSADSMVRIYIMI